jgi:hypothetical protein
VQSCDTSNPLATGVQTAQTLLLLGVRKAVPAVTAFAQVCAVHIRSCMFTVDVCACVPASCSVAAVAYVCVCARACALSARAAERQLPVLAL